MGTIEIYGEDVPCLSLEELAGELALMGEMKLGASERLGDCRVEYGDTFSVDLHLWEPDDPRIDGHLVRTYETDIQHLRDIGVGGTAKYIAFGRDKDGDDVLYTFM